ncbi:MAG: DUF2892 domain-containing protein [Nanoarchaeota archaeon]|nr:DUF2892 domain-containing protein [Nanoarchaeota archaeon]
MKTNVGKTDKIIRMILAIVFGYLGYKYTPWLYIITAILLITTLTGKCGIYKLFGINTCKI